jgi:DNA-directed RNA polymerase
MIALARNLTVWPCFYLPHNFDKRGRIYHVPDFGHHNTDYLRAMFLLANKTPIGDEGVNWIMLAIANSYGNKVDKKSLDARLDWVREHEDQILAVGNDFKKTFEFWSQADDPFQFLAACHELTEAMKVGPEYLSGLPIALDATQSGIQHYAAASLNPSDGELVNIKADLEEPNDLYTACLDVAKQMLEDDLTDNLSDQVSNPVNDNEKQEIEEHETFMADDSVEWSERKRAKTRFERTELFEKLKRDRKIVAAQQWKEHGLERRHIKRNTMTWAYSSRKFGFAKQLQSDEMDTLSTDVRLGELDAHPFPEDNGHNASFYLADINEKAIESVVQSAKAGMEFFQSLARIMTADDKHFRFLTPKIGFPMQQFYREEKGEKRKCYVYKYDVDMSEPDAKDITTTQVRYTKYLDKIDVDKSKSGISPNIIHAMDSTHLMLTVLFCLEEDVNDLMVVHDSFATTVGNASKMSQAIRNAFYYLYNDYCLYTDILDQAREQHSDPDSVEWPEIPRKGDQDGNLLDLSEVLGADYPFS